VWVLTRERMLGARPTASAAEPLVIVKL